MKPHRTLRQTPVKHKDQILNHHQIGVVYTCTKSLAEIAHKHTHVHVLGQSGHTLEYRMKEHKP